MANELTPQEMEQLRTGIAQLGEVVQMRDNLKAQGESIALANEALERAKKDLADLTAKVNAPKLPAGPDLDTRTATRAFLKMARNQALQLSREIGVSEEELTAYKNDPVFQRKLSVTGDSTGAFLVPEDFQAELVKAITQFSPIRSIATVRQTASDTVIVPKRTGVSSATWTDEDGTRSERTGLAYGNVTIRVHELYTLFDITQRTIEDSIFDLESEIRQEFAEQFAAAEGTAFTTGNSDGKPEGFMAATTGVSHVAQGESSTITSADALYTLKNTLKSEYWSDAVWVMNQATWAEVETIKDAESAYLFRRSLDEANPMRLIGYPVVIAKDMADIGAGEFPIAFGSFRRAYRIYDRVGMSMQVDPYTQNTTGAVRFLARKRVGGAVVNSEAIYWLEIATS